MEPKALRETSLPLAVLYPPDIAAAKFAELQQELQTENPVGDAIQIVAYVSVCAALGGLAGNYVSRLDTHKSVAHHLAADTGTNEVSIIAHTSVAKTPEQHPMFHTVTDTAYGSILGIFMAAAALARYRQKHPKQAAVDL